MARMQAEAVHAGVDFDLEVDTGSASPAGAAGVVAAAVLALE